ncbi:hypothetical protein R3P38DRAFT_2611003 [Favolaschia claudopus]|uniref:Uncharacterized protein n=1 Tax=Favolaschia claudopus TaxID=2862362 RepID=A0AAW0CT38_9AGAR
MSLQDPTQAHKSPYSPLFKIVGAWVVALALACGHHAFYASLNGDVASADATDITNASFLVRSQAGASAIGTTFAFLVSASLGVSAGTALLQSSWRVVGQRAFTLSGLDALWSSPTSLLAFLSFDFWRSARGIVVISALAYAFPLVVTFAPGTLIVRNRVDSVQHPCSVPTFDFGSSAILHDELRTASLPYLRPSTAADRLVGSTLLGSQPFLPVSPCGNNCSYSISAPALSFSCSAGTRNDTALTWDWQSLPTSFNPPPYVAVKLDVTPSLNMYSGWDLEAHYSDYASWRPTQTSNNLTCVAYNSTYYLDYTFAGTSGAVRIDKIVPQQPASQISSNTTNGGILDGPTHNAWFNATTNYHAVLESMYSYLIGNVTLTQTANSVNFDYAPPSIALATSPLINAASSSLFSAGNLTWIDFPDVIHSMESLLQNISLSILTGTLDRSQSAQTTCSFRSTLPHFTYDARRLWLVYGAGLLVALFCDLFGVIAIKRNGFGASGEFSDFLAATRNRELNALDLTERDKVKLMYGPVRSEGGRYAFATLENLFSPATGVARRETLGSDKEEPFLPEILYDQTK